MNPARVCGRFGPACAAGRAAVQGRSAHGRSTWLDGPRLSAPREPAALTLVEVLVAATLMSVCLSAACAVLHVSARSRGAAAAAQALQTALAFQSRFEADLGLLVRVQGSPVHYWARRHGRLAFYVADPAESHGLTVVLRAVRYSLDDPPAMAIRECNAREETLGTQPLSALAFDPFDGPSGPLVRVTLEVGRGPDDPPGPPLTHSFLARIPAPRGLAPVQLSIVSGFLDPRDDTSDSSSLPAP